MQTTNKPHNAGTPATTATHTPAEAEKPKSKRGGARKLPEGMSVVKFLMPTKEFEHLGKMADDDDRKAEDLARVLARSAVKKDMAAKAQSNA